MRVWSLLLNAAQILEAVDNGPSDCFLDTTKFRPINDTHISLSLLHISAVNNTVMANYTYEVTRQAYDDFNNQWRINFYSARGINLTALEPEEIDSFNNQLRINFYSARGVNLTALEPQEIDSLQLEKPAPYNPDKAK
ncbi:uncharacterized protein RJT21DRAFT_115963 [Scheffersomyces amazonensis]|uniref:uncharacterized protein n=1 Tax=Scheffersomyces amazonensis TaxID=1078765 RepID=UPI00315DFB71